MILFHNLNWSLVLNIFKIFISTSFVLWQKNVESGTWLRYSMFTFDRTLLWRWKLKVGGFRWWFLPKLDANESPEEFLKAWISWLCPRPTTSEALAEGPWRSGKPAHTDWGGRAALELLGWMTMARSHAGGITLWMVRNWLL